MSESALAQRATPHILTEPLRSHSTQEGKGREEEGKRNANAAHLRLWLGANATDRSSVVQVELAGISTDRRSGTVPNAREHALWKTPTGAPT